MIRIHYTYVDRSIKFLNWWANFVHNIDMNYEETEVEKATFNLKRHRCIHRELAKVGGSWIPGTYYVDFDNEACYTLFLLKWS